MYHVEWIARHPVENSSLPNDEIQVWRIERAEFPAEYLTDDERERAQRFKNAAAKDMYVRARAALRQLMGSYCDKPAAEFIFKSGEHGKPFCPEEKIHFNTTHSKNILLIAFGRERLGIDVESGERVRDPLELARRYFSPEEIHYLESLDGEKQVRDAFLRFWVCKEAALKSSGHGLSGGLDCTGVELDEMTRIRRAADGRTLQALEFVPEEGFCGALVAESPISRENVKWFVLS